MQALLVIYLLPLGDVAKEDVAVVKQALEAFYPAPVTVMEPLPLPKSAWYEPRKRYRAEKLLDFMRPVMPKDGLRIIGLTAKDISTTKDAVFDWGILGLGDLDGKASVISTFRCKMRAKSTEHMRERLAKVAVHEVGHTLSLEHCPNDGCIMHDAMGRVSTIDHEYDLCPRCRALLEKRGHTLEPTEVPWPQP